MKPLSKAAWLGLWTVLACSSGSSTRAGGSGGPAGPGNITPDAGSGSSNSDSGIGGIGARSCPERACRQDQACRAGERCASAFCVVDEGTCTGNGSCPGDTVCKEGACVPFDDPCIRPGAIDPGCVEMVDAGIGGGVVVDAGGGGGVMIRPDAGDSPVKPPAPGSGCHWDFKGSTLTPLVADLDGDGKSEIVVNTENGADPLSSWAIVALRGDTCTPIWQTKMWISGDLSIADLDGDGKPEIVGMQYDISALVYPDREPADMRIVVLDGQGQVRARSDVLGKAVSGYGHATLVADIDGKPPAEIISHGRLFRYVPGPTPSVQMVWSHPFIEDEVQVTSIPAAADLDGDGVMEVVDQFQIFDGLTGNTKTPPDLVPVVNTPCLTEGCGTKFFTATADFNLDGTPDVLVVAQDGIRIYDFKAKRPYLTLLRGSTPFGGGPPLVADFDRDGIPDFGISNYTAYTAFALRCFASPLPTDCEGPGVLWQVPIRDESSGIAGSAAADLDGDGWLEIVYRDELYLHVFSAATGRTLFVQTITSGTATEIPVVADANGDGHADIVVLSDSFQKALYPNPMPDPNTNTPFTGWTQGLFVITNPSWAPVRPMWTQHGYHVTNINDNLTVPFDRANTERTQRTLDRRDGGTGPIPMPEAGPPLIIDGGFTPPVPMPPMTKPLVDLAARLELPICMGPTFTMRGAVCNRGTAAQPTQVPATFYDGAPGQGGTVICTAQAAAPVAPGECKEISCQIPSGPPRVLNLYLRVGDDGTGSNVSGQCRTSNDVATMPNTPCGVKVN